MNPVRPSGSVLPRASVPFAGHSKATHIPVVNPHIQPGKPAMLITSLYSGSGGKPSVKREPVDILSIEGHQGRSIRGNAVPDGLSEEDDDVDIVTFRRQNGSEQQVFQGYYQVDAPNDLGTTIGFNMGKLTLLGHPVKDVTPSRDLAALIQRMPSQYANKVKAVAAAYERHGLKHHSKVPNIEMDFEPLLEGRPEDSPEF